MPKVYLKVNNVLYSDYDVVALENSVTLHEDRIYLSYEVHKEFEVKLANLAEDTSVQAPQQGSEINVIPRCSESIDNIRKCYTIKKGYDTATCNVFSTWHYNKWKQYVTYSICPALETICFWNTSYRNSGDSEFKAKVASMYAQAGISYTDMVSDTIIGHTSLYEYDKVEAWEHFLTGTLTKPALHINKLSLSAGEELTDDVLKLIYIVGSVQANEPDAEKNFVLQLNVLNNYNWREYPHTMYLLFHNILRRNSGCIARSMQYHPSYFKSAYNKVVKQFIDYHGVPSTEITEKDFCMGQRIISKILDVDKTIFVSPARLYEKLEQAGICMQVFETYFNSIVKITPKTNNSVKYSNSVC